MSPNSLGRGRLPSEAELLPCPKGLPQPPPVMARCMALGPTALRSPHRNTEQQQLM